MFKARIFAEQTRQTAVKNFELIYQSILAQNPINLRYVMISAIQLNTRPVSDLGHIFSRRRRVVLRWFRDNTLRLTLRIF